MKGRTFAATRRFLRSRARGCGGGEGGGGTLPVFFGAVFLLVFVFVFVFVSLFLSLNDAGIRIMLTLVKC